MKRTLVAAAVLLASGLASAQSTGWYGGVSVGQASVDLDHVSRDIAAEVEDAGIPVVSASEDDSHMVYKLFLGYQYTPNFAIEAGYADLGKYEAKVIGDVFGLPLDLRGEVKSKAVFIDAVGMLPLTPEFSMFGKVGAAYARTKTHASMTFLGERLSGSDSDSEYVPKAGFGAEYALTKTVALRAEYERYFDVGDEDETGESDVDFWSIGLKFGF